MPGPYLQTSGDRARRLVLTPLVVLAALAAAACRTPGTGDGDASTGAGSPVSPEVRYTQPSPSVIGASGPPPGTPDADADFRFAVKGDWGAGTPAQAQVTGRMCARRSVDRFGDVVTTGDNFYDPDGVATERNYFRPEACLIGDPGHRWRAAWGNHDTAGDSTLNVLGAARNYVWSSGPADFIMLDSNRPDAAQTAWLDSALAASAARWKFVVFHHPPFTGGMHESNLAVRGSWVPSFERYGVSLVLSGHNHLYEHSVVNGVHYVVSGGGGAGLYGCERREAWIIRCSPRHHFLVVRVSLETTTVTAVEPSGAVLDTFVIKG